MDPYNIPPAQSPAAPAPPAESYGAPQAQQYGTPIQPQPKKNRTVIIIVAVVAALLLCCCGVAVAGVLLFLPAGSEVSSLPDELTDSLADGGLAPDEDGGTTDGGGTDATDDTGGVAAAQESGWDAFAPGAYDTTVFTEPSARNQALVEEIHAQLYPDFAIEDIVCEPGYIEGDTYWEDQLYVMASLASDSSVKIAYVIYIELVEAWAGGISYDPADIESYLTLTTSADGTEYIYDHSRLIGFLNGVSEPDLVPLLAQVQTDFPGAVVDYAEIEGETAYVTLTRWEAYPPYAGGFDVLYDRVADGWEYASSEQW